MILRIEKHFKAEQAARKKAEELLQSAIGAEMDAKNKLEDIMRKRQQEQKLLDEERGAITRVSEGEVCIYIDGSYSSDVRYVCLCVSSDGSRSIYIGV